MTTRDLLATLSATGWITDWVHEVRNELAGNNCEGAIRLLDGFEDDMVRQLRLIRALRAMLIEQEVKEHA